MVTLMVTYVVIIARQHARTASHSLRPSLSPFFATLTPSAQFTENTAPLSLLFATLTRTGGSKSCVCRSYTNHLGGPFGSACSSLPLFPLATYDLCAAMRVATESSASETPACLFVRFTVRRLHFFAFFCSAQNPIPFPFNRLRKMCRKTPGVGVSRRRGTRPGGWLTKWTGGIPDTLLDQKVSGMPPV
jgi:hypothetical protein